MEHVHLVIFDDFPKILVELSRETAWMVRQMHTTKGSVRFRFTNKICHNLTKPREHPQQCRDY